MAPRAKPFLEAATVFCLTVAASATLTLGGVWLNSFARSRWPIVSRADGDAKALPMAVFAEELKTGLLSGEECAVSLQSLSAAAIMKFLEEQEPPFWKANANAEVLLRQSARLLARRATPVAVMVKIGELLIVNGLEPAAASRLLSAALSGIAEQRPVDRATIVAILGQAGPEAAVALLETWFDFQRDGSVSSDARLAIELAAQAFPRVDGKLRDDLTEMVVRSWAHRAPPAADAVLFAERIQDSKEFDNDFKTHLLREGAAWLAVSHPDELQRRLVEFAPILQAGEAGYTMASTGFPLDRARQAATAMPQAAGNDFLGGYLTSICSDDPRVMEGISRSSAAKELPEKATVAVVRGLLICGDFARTKEWLGDLGEKEKAQILDSGIYAGFGTPSGSSLRFYLEERTPNGREMEQSAHAMASLPPDEAEALLRGRTDLTDGERQSIREGMAEGRVEAAYRDNPGDMPKFLAALPEDSRRREISIYLSRFQYLDPGTVRQWAGDCPDPMMRDQLNNGLLLSEVGTRNLDDAEKDAKALIAATDHPGEYAKSIEALVSARAETDTAGGVAFVESLPPGELRDKAAAALVKEWSGVDPDAAAAWIGQQPEGAGRDLAIRELVANSRDDPESALANAALISDPAIRIQAAAKVLRIWRDNDPERAAGIISQAGFPEDELPALQRMLRLNPPSSGKP